MTQWRTTLLLVGIVLYCALLFIGGAGWVGDPWDLPHDSARYLAYDYLLVKHRWSTVLALVIYGIVLAVSYRREFLEAFRVKLGREFWIRLMVCSVLLVSAVLLWSA